MITGKGFYIWNIKRILDKGEGYQKIISNLVSAGISHVLVKIANGIYPYNVATDNNGNILYDSGGQYKTDYAKELMPMLQSAGIEVWGWSFFYAYSAEKESSVAIKRAKELKVTGFVIDAESHFKKPSAWQVAKDTAKFMRQGLGAGFDIALSSYRFPNSHPEFPFANFLEFCNINMPQVYWLGANNPAQQLSVSIAQYEAAHERGEFPLREYIPTGSAYSEHGKTVTAGQVVEFMTAAKSRGMPFNFWEYYETRYDLGGMAVWDTIAEFDYGTVPQPPPPPPDPDPDPEPEEMIKLKCNINGLNVRIAPRTSAAIIAKLSDGEIVDVLDIQSYPDTPDTWAKIRRGDGTEGWSAIVYQYSSSNIGKHLVTP